MNTYGVTANLENSLKYFLETEITNDSVTDISGDVIPVYIGWKETDDWNVPCIAIHVDSMTNTKEYLGTNVTLDRRLIIIDVFAENELERENLADWLTETLTDGWTYYTYTVNVNTPLTPTKTSAGKVAVDFVSNTKVNLGPNVSVFDQHRHRITLTAWVILS